MAHNVAREAQKLQKSPDAFRTISEVSAELDVPQHVLRFWETKFKVVKPLKRGGGRRYYRPSDIELIRGIRDLLMARATARRESRSRAMTRRRSAAFSAS